MKVKTEKITYHRYNCKHHFRVNSWLRSDMCNVACSPHRRYWVDILFRSTCPSIRKRTSMYRSRTSSHHSDTCTSACSLYRTCSMGRAARTFYQQNQFCRCIRRSTDGRVPCCLRHTRNAKGLLFIYSITLN